MYRTNTHIHSPYSFSISKSVNEIIKLAKKENIKVIGINDFFTTAAFKELSKSQLDNIYPMYNIEIFCIDDVLADQNIRLNDRRKPGKVYLTGKGIQYPYSISSDLSKRLSVQRTKRNLAAKDSVELINNKVGDRIINFEEIYGSTRGYVSNRHIKKSIPNEAWSKYSNTLIDIDDWFVQEEYMSLESGLKLLDDMGCVKCYPLLLDDDDGSFSELEENLISLKDYLLKHGISCVEFIPGRNSSQVVETAVDFFVGHGFIVLAGSEHHSMTLGHTSLLLDITKRVEEIVFKGCCSIVSYQHIGILDEQVGFDIISKCVNK